MAKVKKGITGGFSGNVGSVSGFGNRYQSLIRAKKGKIVNSAKVSNQTQNLKFKEVSDAWDAIEDSLMKFINDYDIHICNIRNLFFKSNMNSDFKWDGETMSNCKLIINKSPYYSENVSKDANDESNIIVGFRKYPQLINSGLNRKVAFMTMVDLVKITGNSKASMVNVSWARKLSYNNIGDGFGAAFSLVRSFPDNKFLSDLVIVAHLN